jgi:hypothetical protein
MKDQIKLENIADILVYKIAEIMQNKETQYGSIKFIFSPASGMLNCKIKTSRRILLKPLDKKKTAAYN